MRAAVLAAALAAASAALHERAFYEKRFINWMKEHGVKIDDGDEFVRRLDIFAENADRIEAHNAQDNVTYSLGHNAYSHLEWEEFRTLFNLGYGMPSGKKPAPLLHASPADLSALPAEVDWVKSGAVTDVKDQGQCGSCWSFSTTGALEGAYFLKTGKLVSLSEQNLVDCDTYDYACDGGLMDNAFKWVGENDGLCREADYPYTGEKDACASASCAKVDVDVKDYSDVAASDAALMSAIAQQPVSVAIEADQPSFQFYSGGVFSGRCGTNLDHGVLAVGYGTQDGKDYYKVKNSWSSSWGEDGYILIERGDNLCGILLEASYPTL